MAALERGRAAPTPKRAAVREAVLRATEELLRDGATYADLRVERIARAAGISRTAFYFYFRDKRDLLEQLTEEVSGVLYAQADIWWSGSGDPAAALREALTNVAAVYAEHGVLLRVIVEVATYDEDVARFWRSLMGRFVEATERRIEAEARAGRAAAERPAATAFALCWMTERALYEQLAQESAPAAGELVDALAGIWLRAIYRDG
ncbi:MAG TPA: helix-turn-helix domain-containing protein [Solirubrobacteraceae bacterium]